MVDLRWENFTPIIMAHPPKIRRKKSVDSFSLRDHNEHFLYFFQWISYLAYLEFEFKFFKKNWKKQVDVRETAYNIQELNKNWNKAIKTDKIGPKFAWTETLVFEIQIIWMYVCFCFALFCIVCYARLLTAHGFVRCSQSTELNEQAGCYSNESTHIHIDTLAIV